MARDYQTIYDDPEPATPNREAPVKHPDFSHAVSELPLTGQAQTLESEPPDCAPDDERLADGAAAISPRIRGLVEAFDRHLGLA